MAKALEAAHVIVEPLRKEIIKSLIESPKYISQIASSTKSDRSTISYHLGVLEKSGLVNSEYKVLVKPQSKGKAARVYTINRERLNEALEEVAKIPVDLKPLDK